MSDETKCKCQYCNKNISFPIEMTGQTIACPHCGIETILFDPKKNINQPRKQESKSTPKPKSKRPIFALILISVFSVFAIGFVSFLIGKNSQKHNDSSETRTESTQSKPKDNLLQLLSKTKTNAKKPDYPPALPNKVEFTKTLLENFPERFVETGQLQGKFGWMDGEFVEIDSGAIEDYFYRAYEDMKNTVGFTISDKNGDIYQFCYAEKNKFGDLLLGLKSGDRIRVIGQVVAKLRPGTDATFDLFIHVDSIEVIK